MASITRFRCARSGASALYQAKRLGAPLRKLTNRRRNSDSLGRPSQWNSSTVQPPSICGTMRHAITPSLRSAVRNGGRTTSRTGGPPSWRRCSSARIALIVASSVDLNRVTRAENTRHAFPGPARRAAPQRAPFHCLRSTTRGRPSTAPLSSPFVRPASCRCSASCISAHDDPASEAKPCP